MVRKIYCKWFNRVFDYNQVENLIKGKNVYSLCYINQCALILENCMKIHIITILRKMIEGTFEEHMA